MTTDRAVPSKPWLKQYPAGIAAEVDVSTYRSLVDLLETGFARYRDLTAFESFGAQLTYGELDARSRAFAGWLQTEAKLKAGDRVAVMMPNLLQYPIAICGILRAGMVVVNVNPLYTPREVEHQLRDAGARAVVVVENFCLTLQKVLDALPVEFILTTQVGDLLPAPKSWLVNAAVKYLKKSVPAWSIPGTIDFKSTLSSRFARHFTRAQPTQSDLAFLQYTGGTTGLAKGAELTHGNIVANLLQIRSWIAPVIRDADGEQEIIITALPLYHIFALTVNCLTFMSVGARNVLITDPRDMKGFVKTLGQYRFTVITGVNTLFNALLHAKGFDQLDFSSLKLAVGGGAAVLQATAERWKAVTGTRLAEGYGLTETSPVVCFTPVDKPDWNGTIGVPLPSTEVRLLADNEREAAVGEAGELCVRGPQVMRGYWNKPEDTAKVFTADGFLRTGDIATMDDKGYLRIVDRKKDMIIVSGFNVYPNEIEGVVAQHPGVLECACVGVPDDKTGEAVKVFVVRQDPSLTAEAIRAHCKASLTAYKVPRHVEFRDSLPKSNIGKILRKELRG